MPKVTVNNWLFCYDLEILERASFMWWCNDDDNVLMIMINNKDADDNDDGCDDDDKLDFRFWSQLMLTPVD